MAEYTLHCFAQSGNAYKVALMLELAEADWEPRYVDYFGGETRTPAYRAINAMGEVPVLLHGVSTAKLDDVVQKAGTTFDRLNGYGDEVAKRFLSALTVEERRQAALVPWLDGTRVAARIGDGGAPGGS